MKPDDFSVVISAFGNKLDIMLEALINSLEFHYPGIDIRIYGKQDEKELRHIELIQQRSKFCRISPGSLKILFWKKGIFEAKSNWVLFLDADTLILKPLDSLFEFCDKKKLDFLFSWRNNNSIFVNSGVMLVKKNQYTLDFFKQYEKNMLKDIMNFKNDQQTFINLLLGNKTFQSILYATERDQRFIFESSNIKFCGISCEILNNSQPSQKLQNSTLIQHYKGILGTIILKSKKYNRYTNLLSHGIYRYSKDEIFNINKKIEIWKKFSSNDVINILNYYTSTKDKILSRIYRWLPEFLYKLLNKIFLKTLNNSNNHKYKSDLIR